MVGERLITKEQLGEQFILYKRSEIFYWALPFFKLIQVEFFRELLRLLGADEGCRGRYQVVEYQEGTTLSEVLRAQMLSIEDTWLTGKTV